MENLFQTRVKNFENEILPFKNFIANTQLKSLIDFNNTFFDDFRTLGVGELWARQYERQFKLQSLSANAKYVQSQFKKYNDLGIQMHRLLLFTKLISFEHKRHVDSNTKNFAFGKLHFVIVKLPILKTIVNERSILLD